jgi:hypothetical protein
MPSAVGGATPVTNPDAVGGAGAGGVHQSAKDQARRAAGQAGAGSMGAAGSGE